MTPRQCEIAAEAFAASLLAQCGYDVSVQYGANQPDYDLVAIKEKRTLLISVKGSQSGGWMLATRYVRDGVSYHAAIDEWVAKQRDDIVFVFVQFKDISIGGAPRVYLARPQVVAAHLKTQKNDKGHGALSEDWKRAHPASRYEDKIPEAWMFSESRLNTI